MASDAISIGRGDGASHSEPIVVLAWGSITKSHTSAIATARQTIHDRQWHVDEGRKFLKLASSARVDALTLEENSRRFLVRPKWLTKLLFNVAKALLVLAEITAGTAALYNVGDPLLLALITFTGVAVTTVAAGSHIGIQLRRREQAQVSSLVITAALTVALATAMLFVSRYLAVGAVSGVLAFVTTMVALGSAFLSYQWHDPLADELARASDTARSLERKAASEFEHHNVKRFEQAESVLRPAIFRALQGAYIEAIRPMSTLARTMDSAARSSTDRVAAPDYSMVEDVLVALLGPEILQLAPKVET